MPGLEISYRIRLFNDETLEQKLDALCREQTVELPADVTTRLDAWYLTGCVTQTRRIDSITHKAVIRWPLDLIGKEVSSFLNLLYGNVSLMPGIQVTGIQWEHLPEGLLPGPSLGIQALRDRFNVPHRPLLCTAIKPAGFSTEQLSAFCRDFARGGIDIIKDDHSLADQAASRFYRRVDACMEVLQESGSNPDRHTRYFPNITADNDEQLQQRYEYAHNAGCGGVLLCPHITGLSRMAALARHPAPLPIMAHPAFSGSLVANPGQGLTHGLLYGRLWRALGADFAIYPNTGGRFTFNAPQCRAIHYGARTRTRMPFKTCLPTPGGGIQRDRVAYWLKQYGMDTVFLIGGSLYQHPGGITRGVNEIMKKLQDVSVNHEEQF